MGLYLLIFKDDTVSHDKMNLQDRRDVLKRTLGHRDNIRGLTRDQTTDVPDAPGIGGINRARFQSLHFSQANIDIFDKFIGVIPEGLDA